VRVVDESAPPHRELRCSGCLVAAGHHGQAVVHGLPSGRAEGCPGERPGQIDWHIANALALIGDG